MLIFILKTQKKTLTFFEISINNDDFVICHACFTRFAWRINTIIIYVYVNKFRDKSIVERLEKIAVDKK